MAATSAPGASDADGRPDDERDSPAVPAKVIERGNGRISAVPVAGPQSTAPGRAVRYTVEIEGGLGVDQAAVAREVRSALLDRRGWQAADRVRFVHVSPADAAGGARVDIRITLASPSLTDRLCAPLRTLSKLSCWNGSRGRAVLNLRRWQLGIPAYRDVDLYRVYLINHEVGHGLGHGHEYCPRAGRRAPVMQQQSLGMQGCTPWPYPTA